MNNKIEACMITSMLPRVIEGENILLVLMPDSFIRDTWKLGQAITDDFVPHNDWFLEKELAKIRYDQMLNDKDSTSWLLRAIVRKSDNRMIGHFNCHDKPNSPFLRRYYPDAVEFGYTVYQEFRRQGVASEAVLTMMNYLKKNKLAKAIILSATTTNFASLYMIKGLGFKEIDIIRDGNETEKVFLYKF